MIDPNEAPEGYVAAPATALCTGCAFARANECDLGAATGWGGACVGHRRADARSVIFIKREEAKPIGEAIESLFADVDAVLKGARLPSSPDWAIRPIGAAAMDAALPALHRLRDEFAKAALAGSQGRAMTDPQMTQAACIDYWQAACIAYWQADAMLAAKFITMTWGKK